MLPVDGCVDLNKFAGVVNLEFFDPTTIKHDAHIMRDYPPISKPNDQKSVFDRLRYFTFFSRFEHACKFIDIHQSTLCQSYLVKKSHKLGP